MNLFAVNDRGRLITLSGVENGEAVLQPKVDDASDTDSGRSHAASTVGLSYACNAPEVHAECELLRRELGPDGLDRLYQATGTPVHSAYALPQLRVLYSKISPIERKKIHRWQSIAAYCLSRWTDRKELPITYSEASWTGLLNIRDCVFEESAIRLLPPECRATLPELADLTDCVRGIPRYLDNNEASPNPYWARFPELRDARFFLGIGDGACANVGSKCTTSSRIAVTVGTSAAARVCLRHEACSPSLDSFFRIPRCRGLFCYRIDRNHVLVGGALTDGGSMVEWASGFLNLDKDPQDFQRCLDETRALVEAEHEEERNYRHRDLIMAPFLSGERSTGFRDGAAGAIFGFTRETTPAHFFKSCFEGVSLRLKAIIDLLLVVVVDRARIGNDDKDDNDNDNDSDHNSNSNGNTPSPVMVASGKAMEVNHMWRQMIADCTGLHVILDEDTAEGTSRGVTRLVAMSLLAEKNGCSPAEGNTGTGNDNQKLQQSPTFAQHEEELHPFITSGPRQTLTAMYTRKARLQEGFIDSVSPFFSSP